MTQPQPVDRGVDRESDEVVTNPQDLESPNLASQGSYGKDGREIVENPAVTPPTLDESANIRSDLIPPDGSDSFDDKVVS